MRKLLFLPLAGVLLATAASAHIPSTAPSASHELEQAATAMHDYAHDEYSTSYGSHGLEEASAELHHQLHEWSNGEAGEAEVYVALQDVITAYNDYRQQIFASGLLWTDPTLRGLYIDGARAYWKIRWLLLFVDPNG